MALQRLHRSSSLKMYNYNNCKIGLVSTFYCYNKRRTTLDTDKDVSLFSMCVCTNKSNVAGEHMSPCQQHTP